MTGPANKEPNTTPPEEKKEGPTTPKSTISQHGFFHFINENKWEIASYVLLIFGLFVSFANQFFGGLLVGLVLGIYFSQEIVDKASSFKHFIDREGIFRGFIIVAAILALLILAAGLLIGTAIGAWVRPFLGKAISSPFDNPKSQK